MLLETASHLASESSDKDSPRKDSPLQALAIQPVRGANAFAWSPVIRMTLDLGVYDEVYSNTIPGFIDALKALLPSLYDHHCSVGTPGGFFQRLAEGTLLGHVLEHIALELQVMAGMDVTYGKTHRTAKKGIYNVVFSYFHEEAGIFAAKAALNVVNDLLVGEKPDITPLVEHLNRIRLRQTPSPQTQAILNEARRRKIPIVRSPQEDKETFSLGTGKYSRLFQGGNLLPKLHPAIAPLAQKNAPQQVLPLAEQEDEISRSLIRNLHLPFKTASEQTFNENSRTILTNSYRVLLLGGTAPSAVKLASPIVEGNGEASIEALVEKLNSVRGVGSRLQKVAIDDETRILLTEQGFMPDSVLPKGMIVRLKREGLLHNGGAVIEITDDISWENRQLFDKIAKALLENFGYELAELRIITPSLHKPLTDAAGETMFRVALRPDTQFYRLPTSGRGFDLAQNLLAALFPPSETQKHQARIPILAVTASIGAGFLASMLDDALTDLGYTVGRATQDGLFIRSEIVSGSQNFSVIPANTNLAALRQPDIDCAVLEIPLETIMREGLSYDKADVGIVLNIADTAIEDNEDGTLESRLDIAHAHALVAEYIVAGGLSVVNANHQALTGTVENDDNESIYFATIRTNPHLALHCSRGGRALVLDNDDILLFEGKQESVFVRNVTLETTLDKELVLALSASLLAFGIPKQKVREWLKSTLSKIIDSPNFSPKLEFKEVLEREKTLL